VIVSPDCGRVFLASWAIATVGWYWTDPLVAGLNGCILLHRAFPHLTSSGRVLLQSVPLSIKNIIEQNLRDVNASTTLFLISRH